MKSSHVLLMILAMVYTVCYNRTYVLWRRRYRTVNLIINSLLAVQMQMLILVECLSNLNQIKQYTHAFAFITLGRCYFVVLVYGSIRYKSFRNTLLKVKYSQPLTVTPCALGNEYLNRVSYTTYFLIQRHILRLNFLSQYHISPFSRVVPRHTQGRIYKSS